MKICPGCSATFDDDAVFCSNCGSNLQMYDPQPQVIEMPPVTGASQPAASKVTGKKTGMIAAIIAVAFIVVAAIGVGIYFFLNSGNGAFGNNEPVYEENSTSYANHDEPDNEYETTSKTAEKTTASFTSPAPEVVENDMVYTTFFNFYISYLDGINALNENMIDYCTPEIKDEMAERFQYNKKSVFDLSRIDFDVDSFTTTVNGISNEYTFYVKCVSRMYNRETLEEKEINYAVWKVTVTETNGNCVVSKLERDDKYKMSTNVETYDDVSSIF